jgi:hypothetical protein
MSRVGQPSAALPPISSTARRFASLPWALALAGGVLLLLLAPRLFQFVQLGAVRAFWPWQLDFVEGINLNATVQLAEGRNIYRINGPDEFISAPYTPLYHILTLPFAWLSGPSLAGGRIITLLSTVGIAALLALVVRRAYGTLWPGLVAGALWLSLGPTIVWSAFYKQDITAMLLDLGGLALVLARPQGRAVVVAALLFALAFYTKQSALMGAAAAGVWLLARDPKLGVRFGLTLGAMVLVPFAVGNVLLNGGLWEHWVGYHAPLPHDDRRWARHAGRLVGEYWPLLLVSGLAVGGATVMLLRGGFRGVRERLRSVWTPVILYALFGWFSSLSKLGYEGANYNHLLDGLLPSCLLAGMLLAALARPFGEGRADLPLLRAGAATLAVGLLLTQSLIMDVPQAWYRGGWPSPEREREMRGLSQLIASTPGDVYSEDATLLLKHGKRVLYDDASTFVPLARIGQWDISRLWQGLRDRRFSLVLLQGGRFTEEGWQALADNYYSDFPGSIEYYEPKVHPDAPQYPFDCTLARGTERVSLKGYSLGPGVAHTGVQAGGVLRATLYWEVEGQVAGNHASYVHVVGEGGSKAAGRDNPQTGALAPTSEWEPGRLITDTTAIPLAGDLLPGRYRLIAGMYSPGAGGIEPFTPQCERRYGDAVFLGEVEVVK